MKKIILLLLITLLIIQPLVLADESGSVDVTNNFNYEMLNVLIGLDVIPASIESGDFNPNKEVNRGEFAYYIVSFLGMEDFSDNGGTSFSDVPQDHQYAKYISIAAGAGLVSGHGDGTFKPDAPIMYEQCIKIIVNALGYGFYAAQSGGYPVGYLTEAANISLTDKVNGKVGMPTTQGILIGLLYNAMNIDMAVQVGYGKDAKYDITEGNTILTEKRDIGKKKGIVTGNQITSLSGDPKTSANNVLIDNEIYNLGDTKAADLLGYYVLAYYKIDEKTDEKTLLYISPVSNRNDELIVKADDITSYADLRYTYDTEDGETDTVDITARTDVILNGKSLASNYDPSNYDPINFRPLIGEIKLLDNNNDGDYDVLFITSYATTVVDSIDIVNESIMGKENTSRDINTGEITITRNNISLSGNTKYDIVDNTGIPVAFESIVEWNVLSVAKSIDSSFYKIIVSTEQTSGVITEKTAGETANDVEKILIDTIEYKVSKDYIGSEIAINMQGDFYIDAFGNIAYFKSNGQGTMQYGYVKGMKVDSYGVDKRLQLKILSIDNGFIEVKTAASVNVDNGRANIKNNPNFIAGLLSDATGNVKLQPIKYSLNGDGEINKILTVAGGSIQQVVTGGYDKYWSSSATFESKIPVDEEAIVISVPNPNLAIEEDINYAVKKRSALLNGAKYTYDAFKSNLDSDSVDLVVTLVSTTQASAEQGVALVNKISTVINDEGEEIQKVYLLYMGTEVEKLGTTSTTFNNAVAESDPTRKFTLAQGDVIRFTSNIDGDIITPILIFQNSTSIFFGNFTGGMDTQHRTIYGSVYDKTTDYIKICKNVSSITGPSILNTAAIEYYPYKKFSIYVYDSTTNEKVYLGSAEDVKDFVHGGSSFSRVLIQTKNGNPDSLVVYK